MNISLRLKVWLGGRSNENGLCFRTIPPNEEGFCYLSMPEEESSVDKKGLTKKEKFLVTSSVKDQSSNVEMVETLFVGSDKDSVRHAVLTFWNPAEAVVRRYVGLVAAEGAM